MLIPIVALALLGAAAPGSEVFQGFRDAFQYIAISEQLPVDEASVLKLAAESDVNVVGLTTAELYLVIRADFRGELTSRNRGVHGNGWFYVFREEKVGLRFIGRMPGNYYTHRRDKGQLVFTLKWHMSADWSTEVTYRIVGDSIREEGKKEKKARKRRSDRSHSKSAAAAQQRVGTDKARRCARFAGSH